MRYNRKACLRALEVAKHDATRLPFGLVFAVRGIGGERFNGVRQDFGAYWWATYKEKHAPHDDAYSVRFASVVDALNSEYASAYTLLPGLKPRSLKKRELRKQARDLRRMKQYD